MHAPDSLKVDLADPQDIRAKLPEAEKILGNMELALSEQQREIRRWRELVEVLRSVAGVQRDDVAGEPSPIQPPSLSPMQDLVVEVIDREIRKLRAKEVAEILRREGHEVTRDSVSNALWQAAEKAKRIQRAGHGHYAPLAYREELIFDSTNGASQGAEAEENLNRKAVSAPSGDGTGGNSPGGFT